MCGHETALVVLIANFADMPRGCPLHHLRKVAGGMELVNGDERGGLVAADRPRIMRYPVAGAALIGC